MEEDYIGPNRRTAPRFKIQDGFISLEKPRLFKKPLKRPGDHWNLTKILSLLPQKLGRIENIAQGGIAFFYFSSEEQIEYFDTLKLSILFPKFGFSLYQIPIRTKNDFEVQDNNLGLRHRCIKFGSIKNRQAESLKYFLANVGEKISD